MKGDAYTCGGACFSHLSEDFAGAVGDCIEIRFVSGLHGDAMPLHFGGLYECGFWKSHSAYGGRVSILLSFFGVFFCLKKQKIY